MRGVRRASAVAARSTLFPSVLGEVRAHVNQRKMPLNVANTPYAPRIMLTNQSGFFFARAAIDPTAMETCKTASASYKSTGNRKSN